MKKIVLTLFCIMNIALCIKLSAATNVKSIAEIKQLADGTQIIFKMPTTLYFSTMLVLTQTTHGSTTRNIMVIK